MRSIENNYKINQIHVIYELIKFEFKTDVYNKSHTFRA